MSIFDSYVAEQDKKKVQVTKSTKPVEGSSSIFDSYVKTQATSTQNKKDPIVSKAVESAFTEANKKVIGIGSSSPRALDFPTYANSLKKQQQQTTLQKSKKFIADKSRALWTIGMPSAGASFIGGAGIVKDVTEGARKDIITDIKTGNLKDLYYKGQYAGASILKGLADFSGWVAEQTGKATNTVLSGVGAVSDYAGERLGKKLGTNNGETHSLGDLYKYEKGKAEATPNYLVKGVTFIANALSEKENKLKQSSVSKQTNGTHIIEELSKKDRVDKLLDVPKGYLEKVAKEKTQEYIDYKTANGEKPDLDFFDNLAIAIPNLLTFIVGGGIVRGGVEKLVIKEATADIVASGLNVLWESGMEADQTKQALIEQGKSDRDASIGAVTNFAQNLAIIGITNKIDGFFEKNTYTGLKRLASYTVKSGGEALQEWLQQVSQNANTGKPLMEGVTESALLGGIMGFGATVTYDLIAHGGSRNMSDTEISDFVDNDKSIPSDKKEIVKKIITGKITEQEKEQILKDEVSNTTKNNAFISETDQTTEAHQALVSDVQNAIKQGTPTEEISKKITDQYGVSNEYANTVIATAISNENSGAIPKIEELKKSVEKSLEEIKTKVSDIEASIKAGREEGLSELEVTQKLQKEYGLSIDKAVTEMKKFPKDTKQVVENKPVVEEPVSKKEEKIPENYRQAVDNYKQVSLTDTSKGNGALNALIEEAQTEDGKKYTKEQVKTIHKNKNGNVEVYRVGNVREGNISTTISKETAEVISKERQNQGLESKITKLEVKPENIKAVVPGIENEVIVEYKIVETQTEEIAMAKKGTTETKEKTYTKKDFKIKNDDVRELYGNGREITIDGEKYTVHRMSYGDYFLQPSDWQGSERDGFSPKTLWLKKSDIKDTFEIDTTKEDLEKRLNDIKNEVETKTLGTKEEPIYSVSTYDGYNQFIQDLQNGVVSVDQFKQAYEDFKANRDLLKSDLEKATKDTLFKRSGGYARRDAKKSELVDEVLSDMGMRFALGKSVTYSFGEKMTNSLDAIVKATTKEDIDSYAQKVAKMREERAVRMQELTKAIKNPETFEEFKTFIEINGEEKLTPEQRVKYEEQVALRAKEKEAQKVKETGSIAGVQANTEMTITEEKHSKTGETLFKVSMGNRVDKETYITLNTAAKKLGGYYSTFSKGFLFKDRAMAESFKIIGKGENVVSTRPEEMVKEKQQNAGDKLEEMADRLEQVANEEKSRERKANTARRARMASSAEAKANNDVALALTMKNLARAIKSGEAKLLDRLSTKSQIEQLDTILRQANHREHYSKSKETGTFGSEPITEKTVEFVENYIPTFYMKGLEDTLLLSQTKKGLMRASKNVANAVRMEKAGGKEILTPNKHVMEDIKTISDGLLAVGVEPAWQLKEYVAEYKRLQALGITSTEQLRATLREYLKYKEAPQELDKVKELERDVVGKKVGFDFFPTPKMTAEAMVDMAGIEVGMKVLEPSAGNGNIAEAIRGAGVEPDVAEISGDLRGILEAKGFSVVAHDFMEITDKYDRIVMNPPFSNNQDIAHLQHAYELLNDGGKIVSIVGEGAFIRSGKKETEFRKWLDDVGAIVEELPQGTFQDVNLLNTTSANARIVEISKAEAPRYKLVSKPALKMNDEQAKLYAESVLIAQEMANGKISTEEGNKLLAQNSDKFDKTLTEEQRNDVRYKLSSGELTTKILKTLEGKKTVSKQYISDLTNRTDVKDVERNLVRDVLTEYGDTVNVKEFTDKVRAELLPLKVMSTKGGYEARNLEPELRGNVAKYAEHTWESPIKTSAGEKHPGLGGSKNYFGHTRIEDMADNKTRRVIEVQSDLYQKGNLEREGNLGEDFKSLREKQDYLIENIKNPSKMEVDANPNYINDLKKLLKENTKELETYRVKYETKQKELSKLQQYNDPTAHFRMVREEIKKAAQDGKTKLQFPTGETAMKIEGLGASEGGTWRIAGDALSNERLLPEKLKVGLEIRDANVAGNNTWIITDVLGDGKFKAIQKNLYNGVDEAMSKPSFRGMTREQILADQSETFDISGKVDTNNPIYKFYEKTLAKYLANRYGAKRVTDEQGVSWFEITLTQDMGGAVEAFKIDSVYAPVFDRSIKEIQSGLSKIFGRNVGVVGMNESELMQAIVTEGGFKPRQKLPNGVKIEALGAVIQRTIHLLRQGNSFSEVIANHEGWHWFKTQLSVGTRNAINEIEQRFAEANPEKVAKLRKEYSGVMQKNEEQYRRQGKTDEQIQALHTQMINEELMADEFATYYRTGKTLTQKIAVFFKRALQQLKLLFSKQNEVRVMFENVQEILATTGGQRTTFENRIRMKLRGDKFPEFNTGDKTKDAKLALEAAEKRVGVEPVKPRKIPVSGKQIELPEELQNEAVALDFEYESIEQNPLNDLWKYANKKEGVLPEVVGGDTKSVFGKKGDTILDGDKLVQYADQNGNVDSEKVREAFSQFIEDKRDFKKRQKEYKDKVKAYKQEQKDTLAMQKLAEIEDRKIQKDIRDRQAEREKQRHLEEIKKAEAEGQKRAEKQALVGYNKKVAITTPAKELGFWAKMVGQKLNPLKYTDKSTQNIFNSWNRKLLMGRVRANKEASAFIKIPNKEGLKTILDYEAGVVTKYSDAIKEKFANLLTEARERGIDMGFRENYLPHVYMENAKEIGEKIHKYLLDKGLSEDQVVAYENGQKLPDAIVNMLKINPFFSKERVFPTYKVAMEYGLTPKYTNVSQLVGHYVQELETIVANNELVTELSDAGKILPFEDAPFTWDMVNLPFSQKGYMANSNIARVINGLFGKQEPTLWTYMSKVSKKLQEIRFSAGLPYTTVNFFALGQLIKELTAGNIKAVNAFFRANFNGKSVEWLKQNREYVYKMARQGIDMRKMIDSWEDLYSNLSEADGFMGKTKDILKNKKGEVFNQMFNKNTFMSFMPQMQIQLFKDVYNGFLKKGYPEDIAEELAGRVVSKNFGLTDFSGRSKATQDKISALFFAPYFRESVINTLYNTGVAGVDFIKNLGGLRSPLDPTLQRNRRLLIGMILTYFLYNLLNKALNDGDNLWDNPANRKFALQIPSDDGTLTYIEFMPSFLSFARSMASGAINLASGDYSGAEQKFGTVFSMPIKIVTEILGHSDYYDRDIYKETDTGAQKTLKIAKYLLLQTQHQYIAEMMYQIEEKKPLYQSIISAMELPLKFSSRDTIARNEYYDALDAKAKQNARDKERIQPTYDEVQKLKDAGDFEGANAVYNSLSDEDKVIYKKIMRTPANMSASKEDAYSQAMADWETGDKNQQKLDQIEVQIASSVYGVDYTKSQLNQVTKDFAFIRVFGQDNQWANDIKDAKTNEEKVQVLNRARQELGLEEFKKLFNNGRKVVKYNKGTGYVLISDQLKEMYFSQ